MQWRIRRPGQWGPSDASPGWRGGIERDRGLLVTLVTLNLDLICGLFLEPKTMPSEVVHKR